MGESGPRKVGGAARAALAAERFVGNSEGEAVICIDDKELSLREFGRLLTVDAGWGMRIAFVPDDLIEEEPKVEVRVPKRRR